MPWLLVAFLLLALLAWWEIWVCEGAHLGRGFVVWLYDRTARRYESIKQYDWDWERRFLGDPVSSVLRSLGDARVLDVGAGTGRMARALREAGYRPPLLVNVEPSGRMTAIGVATAHSRTSPWIRAWAEALPFAGECFDLAASLEMLEFTPSPRRTLAEIGRVIRPGGWLLVTNRIGREARWIFGRTYGRTAFEGLLDSLGFEEIESFPWQVEYDLIWARKPEPLVRPEAG